MSEQSRQLTIKQLLSSDAMKARFAEVLKAKAPGFLASVTSQSAAGPLANVNPQSVMAAAFVAATLDLPVDRNLGFAWIVPYKGQAQFQMGYKGYIQLAQRTGLYQRMNAFAVNEGVFCGYDEVGEPILDFSKMDESQDAVGYAFAFKLLNGFTKVVYWPKSKVEKHARRYSQSFGSSSSPWKSNFDEMALKTVTANALKKWGPLSVELQTGLRHDQGSQSTIDAEVTYLDGQEKTITAGMIGQGATGANPLEDSTSSVGTEAPGSTGEPLGGGESVPETAAPASTPAEKPKAKAQPKAEEPKSPSQESTPNPDALRWELEAKCKESGIDTSDLALYLASQSFVPNGTTFKGFTVLQMQAVLKSWDEVRDGVKGQ